MSLLSLSSVVQLEWLAAISTFIISIDIIPFPVWLFCRAARMLIALPALWFIARKEMETPLRYEHAAWNPILSKAVQ